MSENYSAERGLEKTRKLIQKVGIEGMVFIHAAQDFYRLS